MNIVEEPTEENLKQLINSIPSKLSPVERVLLCNYGTNQTLLSVLFEIPIKVKILSQHSFGGDTIIRWAQLAAEYSPDNVVTVCLAESVIPRQKNPPGFMTAIREQKMGIGQVIQACQLKSERSILGFFANDNIIARNYTLTGDIEVLITEIFPRDAIRKAEGMV